MVGLDSPGACFPQHRSPSLAQQTDSVDCKFQHVHFCRAQTPTPESPFSCHYKDLGTWIHHTLCPDSSSHYHFKASPSRFVLSSMCTTGMSSEGCLGGEPPHIQKDLRQAFRTICSFLLTVKPSYLGLLGLWQKQVALALFLQPDSISPRPVFIN